MAQLFGQLCKCSTLEDISVGIGVSETFIKDLGLKQSPAKSTMSDGNKRRTWQVFERLYAKLLGHYGSVLKSKSQQQIIKEVEHQTILIRDSSTISLCLSLLDWAKFTHYFLFLFGVRDLLRLIRTAKGGLKIHKPVGRGSDAAQPCKYQRGGCARQ